MSWALVTLIVASTTAAEGLQSHAMRRGGRAWKIPLSFVLMALSFFAWTQLLKVAELSFAVPATAATVITETLMARWILKENVCARRWTGALLVAAGVYLVSH